MIRGKSKNAVVVAVVVVVVEKFDDRAFTAKTFIEGFGRRGHCNKTLSQKIAGIQRIDNGETNKKLEEPNLETAPKCVQRDRPRETQGTPSHGHSQRAPKADPEPQKKTKKMKKKPKEKKKKKTKKKTRKKKKKKESKPRAPEEEKDDEEEDEEEEEEEEGRYDYKEEEE